MKRNIVVAITGASGVTYSLRLLEVLLAAGCDVHLMISAAGQASRTSSRASPGALGSISQSTNNISVRQTGT